MSYGVESWDGKTFLRITTKDARGCRVRVLTATMEQKIAQIDKTSEEVEENTDLCTCLSNKIFSKLFFDSHLRTMRKPKVASRPLC